jgi:hypothetical protein
MKQLEQRIYIKQWAELKPYKEQARTDIYYLRLCNEVKKALAANTHSATLLIYLTPEEIDMLACFLTSYFEDLISQTNIWSSFIRIHKKLYGKELPFYDLSEYYADEINMQDVSFLIWYFINSGKDESLIAPVNSFIIESAYAVMEVFDEAWEDAPENQVLKKYYTLNEDVTDFYTARNLIDTILFKSYLFYPDTQYDLLESEVEIIEEKKRDEQLMVYLNENRDFKVHHAHTRLLGLSGKEWAAEILGESHPLSEAFNSISQKIRGYFFYKGQDEKNLFLEHIASGKKFNMTKKSFDHYEKLEEIDTILYMGIVLWQNEWWFSGVYFQSAFDANLVLDEKNSIESRKAVNFLDHEKQEVHKYLEIQFEAFKAYNDGSQIAFMPASEIQDFFDRYMAFYNESLNLSEKEQQAAFERARKEGFFVNDEKSNHFSDVHESALVFYNPKSGIEIGLDVNSAFPIKNNPFYVKEDSKQHIIRLLLSESISPELVRYCLDTCKSKLTFFKDDLGKLYLENMDFLLRFYKRGNYFTKPEVTFSGIPK